MSEDEQLHDILEENNGDQASAVQDDSAPVPLWDRLEAMGIPRQAMRIGINITTIVVILFAVLAMRNVYTGMQSNAEVDIAATAQAMVAPTVKAAIGLSPEEAETVSLMPAFDFAGGGTIFGITRYAAPETIIPSRERVDIELYTVVQGDSVFSIADQYNIRPETILWGNYESLEDNPREISIGLQLNILPTDGVYYKYNVGESLNTIAEYFGVFAQDIVEWPGNKMDPYETDIDHPPLSDGAWLIVPGGEREIRDWGPPAISRDNPATAAYYGPGSCGAIYEGPVGNGTFVWPTTQKTLSGYNYNPSIHPALDIGGSEGNAIYATDAGVVVYAGWSNTGYGYLIVIDHGNGWQSAYAHLSGVGVYCGQGVYQGHVIGGLGNTGNSTGAHLHFELRSEIYGKVNPWNFLSQ